MEESPEEPKIDKRIGAQSWKARSSHGRNPIFKDPEQLRIACEEYIEWVDSNPLQEERIAQYQGVFVKGTVEKMRAMTLGGLCIFLDICRNTWDRYREEEDFLTVTKKIEEIIRDQKFTGAAADLLNANIIARDLGLKDKIENESTVKIKSDNPDDYTDEELLEILKGRDK
jgi:hypothetical protein